MRKLTLAALLVVASACASKRAPTPVVSTPKFPDFLVPAVPSEFAGTPAAEGEARGWAFLQTGDTRTAAGEFSDALKALPAFYPAEISLGYVELARQDPKAALSRFDQVLEKHQHEVSALVGRGLAQLALEHDADALAAFQAALKVDPGLVDIARRIDIVRFRAQQQGLTRARASARAGRMDDAVRAYKEAIAGSPDSPFLYRELADVERQADDLDAALEHYQKAVSLDATDARSLVQMGAILEGRGDFDGALKAYGEALAIEPGAELEARIEGVRQQADLAKLPAEYHAIDAAPQVTRADVAALLGVRLAPLVRSGRRRDAVLITDVRGNWAAPWIIAVARAGLMDPFANHAFQPRTIVRRIDLAQVVSRLLARTTPRVGAPARPWESARLTFTDLSSGHLAYVAASQAVAAGIMTVGADKAFQPSRPVTGAEAIQAIDRVAELAGFKESR